MWKELLIAVLFVAIKRKNCDKLNLDLPEYQFNYVLRTHRPEVIRHCSLDPDNAICQYINSSRHIKCWGYEEQNDCQRPQNAYYVRPGKWSICCSN